MKTPFKTIDEKFAEIGLIKVQENQYGAIYERYDEKFKFTQIVDIGYKASGKHIVQSYDKDLFDTKMIGNTCVGLTMYEMFLCYKKMKKMGWKFYRENGRCK